MLATEGERGGEGEVNGCPDQRSLHSAGSVSYPTVALLLHRSPPYLTLCIINRTKQTKSPDFLINN